LVAAGRVTNLGALAVLMATVKASNVDPRPEAGIDGAVQGVLLKSRAPDQSTA
jgi:hypothetical protein